MKTFLKISLFVLILLIGIGALGVYWTFYRTLPDYRQTVTLETLEQPVDIHWDQYGVPHIYAENLRDLYHAIGYVHAQDRLWQMTLTQLASEGRLAEFFGKELVSIDIFQRTIGFWDIARELERQLPDSTRRLLQAYADGVNEYVSIHDGSLPPQFSLADIQPVKWTVTHSLALARLMAWELNIAWKNELSLAVLQNKLTGRQMNELFPEKDILSLLPDRPETGLSEKPLFSLLEQDQKLKKLLGMEGYRPGSNAWAVDASKTGTGYPLLAGDPHLGLNMPGKWYEVHLHVDGRNLSGATLAGAPLVILGQNDVLAWSLTNVMTDDTDFYIEALNPANHNQYILDTLAGEPLFENFEREKQVIKIKNEADTVMVRSLTKHGPVISEIYPDTALVGDRVITMKWTGHERSNELQALMEVNWAQSFEQFREALPHFRVPGQNITYADTAGNIALYSLAAVPIRSGNPLFFRRGWKPDDDWQGYVPFDRLPKIVNPAGGWVGNANNPVQPDEYSYYISAYWEPDSRYNRLRQFLTRNEQLTPQAFQAMQMDTYSDYAEQLTGVILPILKGADKDYNTVISYLENWDYRYELSETAASIMDAFVIRLSKNTFEDEFGSEVYSNFLRFNGLPARILLRFMKENSTFFDNIDTESTETRADIVTTSMDDTIRYFTDELGEEPFEWRWETIHTLTLESPLFSEAAKSEDAGMALKLIVNNILNKGPYPVRGNKMSLNNGEYRWTDPFNMVLGPSIRRIVDFSDMSKTLSITPTGQSGNPLSQYYGDQTENWLNGQYKFVYQDSTLFDEIQYRTTRLVPGK